jgi:hypothetical protein
MQMQPQRMQGVRAQDEDWTGEEGEDEDEVQDEDEDEDEDGLERWRASWTSIRPL